MTVLRPASPRHFLDLDRCDAAELRVMLDTAARMKRGPAKDGEARPLAGKTLAMIFEKPSPRTRVSVEVAATPLGGHAVVLEPQGTQTGSAATGRPPPRALSRTVVANRLRTPKQNTLLPRV